MTTATEIQQGTRRTISGAVQNPREDGHGHYLIDLQGTGWTQDKYSVTAFEVAGQETLAALPVGRHIEVVVEAQQKRDGKDGSRERDWYWRIVGPSNGAAPAAEGRSPLPGEEGGAVAREQRTARLGPTLERPSLNPNADKYSAAAEVYSQWMMNRRTALMQATKAILHDSPTGGDVIDLDDVIFTAADRRFAWLQGTTAPDTEPERDEPPTNVDDLPFDPSQEPPQ